MSDASHLRLKAQSCREVAAHFRSLANIEPAESLRRRLQRLAARHDKLAADLEQPQLDEEEGHAPSGAGLGSIPYAQSDPSYGRSPSNWSGLSWLYLIVFSSRLWPRKAPRAYRSALPTIS